MLENIFIQSNFIFLESLFNIKIENLENKELNFKLIKLLFLLLFFSKLSCQDIFK